MTSDTGKTLRRAADPAQVYLRGGALNQVLVRVARRGHPVDKSEGDSFGGP